MEIWRSRRERNLWGLTLGVLLLIYSTLGVVRPLTEALRDRGLLIPGLGLLAAALLGALGRLWWRQPPGPREAGTLGAIALAYGALFFFLHTPEEAMHFVQYGLVAALAHAALRERRRSAGRGGSFPDEDPVPPTPSPWPAVGAFLFTVTAGWLDEGIQWILPSRYYDLRDVGLNAAAAALAVAAVAGREWARGRDERK